MKVDQNFVNAIKPIIEKFQELVVGDFVIFGSAPLYLLGIRKFEGLNKLHDLDVTLDGHLKDESIAKVVYFENDLTKPLRKIVIDGFEIDIGSHWPADDDCFYKIFDNPVIVDDIKFANLNAVLEFKKRYAKMYNREKDKHYVELIDNYLSKHT